MFIRGMADASIDPVDCRRTLISAGVANAFSWDLTKEQQAQQLVKQFQVMHQVPSVAVGITVNGNPVFARSFDIDGSIVPGETRSGITLDRCRTIHGGGRAGAN